MLGKTDVKVSRPRDGRHCDLCGCSFPAVRCDKCGSQIFCLSCDDMYHRHPKRRFHLRKAVDPTPTPQARPVLPMKVSQLASSPGDPSKMPLPPPRKKKPGKSFFDTFRRGSPSSDNSPPLPKKEYSWSDRLGSIKKFMSNRPLPPLPKDEDNEEQNSSSPVPRKNDLSFIHKRVDEKPPQLPHRTQVKSPRKHSEGDVLSRTHDSHLPDKQAEWASSFEAPMNNFQQTPLAPSTHHLNGQANRDSSEREFSAGRFRSRSLQDDMSPTGLSPNFSELPNLSPTMPPDVRGYSTLKRAPTHGQDLHNQSFMSMPGDHFPGMHTSSSVTDLHTLDSPSPRGPQQFPNFPMPPHYPHPYPMYPHYPNYPQYFGTSFANLSTVLPNTDGDFSDHSDASSFSSKKPKHSSSFGMKAKRSQSVMYDRMAYPPQYYPFGGFPPHPPLPGYGAAPWGQSDQPAEEPASPATSIRSFGRSHRSRHRKKKMVASENDDEDDERLSIRSSPRSRTTSSSDRLRRRKTPKKIERSASPSSLTSSEEEEENKVKEDRLSPETHTELSQGDGYQTKLDKKKASKQAKDAGKSEHKTKQHGSKIKATSHQKLKTDDKNFSPKVKKKEKEAVSSSESMEVNEEQTVEAPEKAEDNVQDLQDAEMKGESDYHSEDDKKETMVEEQRIESALSESQWQCEHCTFINSTEHRICQVCCKTKPGSIPQSDPVSLMVPEMQATSSTAASPILNTTSESLTSDTAKEYLTPPVPAEDDSHSGGHSENEGQNFAKLNSDLEQAEKELSRGLMELMKLKEESDLAASNAQAATRRPPEDIPATDSQVLTTQDTQTDSKPAVPQIEPSFPQVNDRTETLNEQLNQQLNAARVENVASKSIGTDAMDFDFKPQTHGPENITGPTQNTLNYGLFTQEQISPANSFTEITSSAPSQKDITGKPTMRRDSSCQTYQDESSTQMESDIPTLPHGVNLEFQHPYNRADAMRSPQLPPIAPSGYRGFAGRGQGLMHRSHSRSSLFGDRYGDTRNVPPEFDNLGFGFGPSPMYRSLSRSSLTGDYSDPWMSEVRSLRRPDFYLSMEELVERRRLETKRAQGLELVRMIRDAEQQGFTADDIHVALNNCGKQNPVDWLQTNWKGMVDTVVTLATNYGKDKHENDIGVLSDNEARDALRMHKGNIWAAVTECVEGRQRKFLELRARGNFSTKEIVDALTQSEGNVELAYTRLSATTLKPFLMRIWGAGEGVENQDGAVPTEFLDPESAGWPKNSTLRAGNVPYGDSERCSDQEDWDDDDDVEEEVSWNEDEEEEMENPKNFDIEPQIVRREKRGFVSHNIATPESDSEYCDAFDPVGDARSATSSSPVDEIFFVSPDDVEPPKDKKKGASFLSRLAALRKNKKAQVEDVKRKDANYIEHNLEADSGESWDTSDKNEASDTKIRPNDSTSSSSETNKIYSPLNILKQTFSAIKDSVIGSGNKNEAKHPRSMTEARTIIVHDRGTAQETLPSEENTQIVNNRDISNKSSHRAENKSEYIPKINNKSDSKENDLVDKHRKTLKYISENKTLPTTSETPDVQIHSVSNSSAKEPVEKQRGTRNSESDTTTTAKVAGLQNTQNNLEKVSMEYKPEKESFPVAEPLPPKPVEEETKEEKTSTLDVSEQSQDISDTSVILKNDRKGNICISKEAVSKKAEEGKFPTQEKSAIVPEKAVDSSNNKDGSRPQAHSHKPAMKLTSNELGLETIAKNDIEMDTSPQQITVDVINDVVVSNDTIEETAKPAELRVGKSSDEKPKTKKLKAGLRLKLPDLEKTVKSETQKDQAQPDKQTDEPVAKAVAPPKDDTYLEEKRSTEKEEGDKILESTIENRPILAEQVNVSQNSHRDHGSHSDLFQGKTADGNSSSTAMYQKEEEKSVIGEKPKSNISENEFHDMASKITEKLENCLEVLKSSEEAFTKDGETTPPRSEVKGEVSASGKSEENDVGSFQSNSETLKMETESTTTDVPKISADREEMNDNEVRTKGPSPVFTGNEVVLMDDMKPTERTITEVIASPDKDVSPGVVKEHDVQDSKTSELSSIINTVSDNKSASHSPPHDTAQTAASATNAVSPASQIASSSASPKHSDMLTEAPVEFAGVKAKTFTGLNKKGKGQLYGSDKKQKDSSARSPTPKVTPDVRRSGKVSAGNEDSSDIKQILITKTAIQETENITQSQQGETEQSVHSITTKEETASSSNEHRAQITPDGHKNDSPFPIQTELTEISSELVTTDTKISNQAERNIPEPPPTANAAADVAQAEQNIPESPPTANAAADGGKTEAKSELATSESQPKGKEKKNALSATKNEPLAFSSSKFSTKKFKDQDMKSTIPATNKESSVPASSKVTGTKTKDSKDSSTIISSNSSTSVSASTKSSDITAKEEESKSVKDTANTETTAYTSGKSSDIREKEADVQNSVATTSTEASVSPPDKDSDIKAKEQDAKIASPTAKTDTSVATPSKVSDIKEKDEDVKKTEASVSIPSKISDIKAKEQDVKNSMTTDKTDALVSIPSKGSDIKAKEQDVKNAVTTAKTEASVSIPSKSSDIKAKEPDTKAITAVTSAISTAASVSTLNKSSYLKTEESDSKKDMAAVEEEASASVTKKDTDTETKENNAESVAAATATNDASASSSRTRPRLKMEIQDATETSNLNEDSVPSSPVIFGDKRPTSRVEALKNSLNEEREGSQGRSQSPLRPQSPFGRMTSLSARKEAIANERSKEVRKTPTIEKKPWFIEKAQAPKSTFTKRSIKQQLEFERKIRNLVAERKCRTYRKAEVVVQLLELNFAEAEALQAAHECSNLEQAISYLQQECLLCTGMYPVGQIVSMIHCPHKACRECIKAYFTIQIRDRTIMELLCPFCNEPDMSDEDVAQDYFNHLDIMLKKLVEPEIHELFQRKLRDRVLMKDPNFRWCSQCSSGFIAMPNLKRLICPDCNAITCAKCRRPWERDHEGISCEAFAAWKDANDPEAQSAGLAKLLQEDGIDCPNCHFRYTLAKGGCMHFRCIQCQHDFCSGCSKPFKMGQKCGVSEFCGKLGLHAHHPRNCLFYLRDKDPEDLQRLLDLNDIEYNKDPPEGMELKSVCQVMEQKETSDGLVDDICRKDVQEKQAGLCRVHYVEYLGQLVNKHKIDPIQIFCNDDLELVLRRASKRLPAKSYRDTEIVYRERLVQLIQEELPLELTEGS